MILNPKSSFFTRIETELDDLKQVSRFRSLFTGSGIILSGNDYLNLSHHPSLRKKAIELAKTANLASTGSRLLGGNHPLHEELESLVAAWKKSESSLLFNSGYDANMGVIQTLIRKEDIVFSDKLNHACIIDGIRGTGAVTERFNHQDFNDLERRLEKHEFSKTEKFIIVESVYSMDGDITDFPSLVQLCEKYNAHLIVDEAHGTGVIGQTGAGVLERDGLMDYPLATIHTCGKALGTFGAFVSCRKSVRDYLVNKCRNFIFTTALPPWQAGLIAEAIRLVQPMTDERDYLMKLSADFRKRVAEKTKWSTGNSQTMIVPVIIGEDSEAVKIASLCREAGFDVRAVRPPTVPEGTSRLRLSFHAGIQIADMEKLAELLAGNRLKA